MSALSDAVPGTPHFTAEQLDEFCRIFRTLPTYRAEDDAISSSDVPVFYRDLMKWERTQEQIDVYVDCVERALGGRMTITQYLQYFTTQHDKHDLFRVYVENMDLNKDGFISPEEFKLCWHILKTHDPTIAVIDFEELLEQADTNKDGKLSNDELVAWLKKFTSRGKY